MAERPETFEELLSKVEKKRIRGIAKLAKHEQALEGGAELPDLMWEADALEWKREGLLLSSTFVISLPLQGRTQPTPHCQHPSAYSSITNELCPAKQT